MCENLVKALELVASLVQVLVEGLQERSRLKMTEDIMVDDHEAVKIGLGEDLGITLGGGAQV